MDSEFLLTGVLRGKTVNQTCESGTLSSKKLALLVRAPIEESNYRFNIKKILASGHSPTGIVFSSGDRARPSSLTLNNPRTPISFAGEQPASDSAAAKAYQFQPFTTLDHLTNPHDRMLVETADSFPGCDAKQQEFETAIVEKCKLLWVKKIKDPEAEEAELELIDTKEVRALLPYELPTHAKKSKEAAKEVAALLKKLDPDRLTIVASVFLSSVKSLICDQFVYFVLCVLIKLCPEFRHNIEFYCLENFYNLVYDGYAIRVLWTLNCSDNFCVRGLKLFEKRFDELVMNMGAVQVLTSLIAKTPSESDFEFVFRYMEKRIMTRDNSHILRVLSTMIERAKPQTMEKIALILKPHIHWLMDDKLGNFGIQALFKRECPISMEEFKDQSLKTPVKIFIQKYRKYGFIEVMRKPENGDYLRQVIWGFIYHPKNLHVIFSREDSSKLLLAVLSFAKMDRNQYELFNRLLFQAVKTDPRIGAAAFFKEFVDLFELLRAHRYSRLLESIQYSPDSSKMNSKY